MDERERKRRLRQHGAYVVKLEDELAATTRIAALHEALRQKRIEPPPAPPEEPTGIAGQLTWAELGLRPGVALRRLSTEG